MWLCGLAQFFRQPQVNKSFRQDASHASAILKNPTTYEHIDPAAVGNTRIIPMSNQAGQSNLRERLGDMGLEVAPGDPALAILGAYATPENVARLNRELGLDRSLPEQYLIWLGNLLQGDLGRSYALNRPVVDEVLDRFGEGDAGARIPATLRYLWVLAPGGADQPQLARIHLLGALPEEAAAEILEPILELLVLALGALELPEERVDDAVCCLEVFGLGDLLHARRR